MNKTPIAMKDGEKKEPAKVYKSIAPTTVATTNRSYNSSNTQPLQKNVPAFLNKLYSMVNDPESDDLICWAEDGASFFVNRQEEFARKVLPRFFKHNKFSSFVRQLNMYGFHKVPHLQQGVLETDSESERWEFSNPHFQRNQPDLLLLVTRKKGPASDEKEISNIDLQHILEEIQSIKKHQMNISTQLQAIQRDNQALWQETVQARERHLRHQETIDKILRFLASVFSNGEKRPAISRKRRFLLGPAEGDDHEAEIEDGQRNNDMNNKTNIKNNERPKKMARQQDSSNSLNPATFNIEDYVNENNDLIGLSTTLPAHLKNSATTTPSSDLEDAIALNDQSKHDTSLSSSSDFSSISNVPHLQNLQSLVSLAQTNPDLLNQLTNETLFNNNSSASFLTALQPQQSQSNHHHPVPNFPVASTNLPTTVTFPNMATPLNTTSNTNNTKSLTQVTNTISNIASSADALNQDIDELGLSLQALAQHLGFDPTKISTQSLSETTGQTKIEDGLHESDLINMDEFLNTYGPDIPSNENVSDISSATITDIPSISSTRSPSPVVSASNTIDQANH
ncbi:uncharacterized protein BX663DRAFT_488969 [Cokeromyces recurvatus]|uniref:uncharacterized protein n=1 Tax=Cokeromyces recurvatus TaxID=90255 RepID=UPI00221F1DAD|nr:uncharacterized protein BX663DRAFT_488969 [Cokeromyces recurvatus]KAI7899739.1 hypothetical protein BX663DRAFT_488969 [Cokeromyces recurvatus]